MKTQKIKKRQRAQKQFDAIISESKFPTEFYGENIDTEYLESFYELPSTIDYKYGIIQNDQVYELLREDSKDEEKAEETPKRKSKGEDKFLIIDTKNIEIPTKEQQILDQYF